MLEQSGPWSYVTVSSEKQRHRHSDGHVGTEAETSDLATIPGLPAPPRGWEDEGGPSLQVSEGAPLIPLFWTFSLQNWERIHFCGLKPPGLLRFVSVAQEVTIIGFWPFFHPPPSLLSWPSRQTRRDRETLRHGEP